MSQSNGRVNQFFDINMILIHLLTFLHTENKGFKLNVLESMEINKLKNTDLLLNDQLDLNRFPLLNLFCGPFHT